MSGNNGGMINLPEEVWDKLRELQIELDEGEDSLANCFILFFWGSPSTGAQQVNFRTLNAK